jgi:(hydroxyamino)benzene mutase
MTETTTGSVERFLGVSAAALFLISLLTGLFAGAAMNRTLAHVDGHAALASHLNALMGTFLFVAYGWTLPLLRYGHVGKMRIAVVLVVSSTANWAITALKACWSVAGLSPDGSTHNLVVFTLLQITVVLPAIGAAIAWVAAFRRR